MKNGAKETCSTCSISRIHLIKSTIANSEETKKQLTSNIHHCKIQLNNIVSRQEKRATKTLVCLELDCDACCILMAT